MNPSKNRNDFRIDRNHPDYPQSAVLIDHDGNTLYRFDKDWTDDHIFEALDFAIKSYFIGVRLGREKMAKEIRQILDARQ
ncbi:hypothetical protein GSUB_17035 (plasmid) [Geoalkalibacter subterraneus]|uniref:Uncharacterized protein n=1 Tax=Geoalkalibacter subterraneus TaxID=483547 RepID=A0A0B5FJ41_9BACT|nr:hypothetical protein GSUB_17035 [Geoalkalibacter subterraneus]